MTSFSQNDVADANGKPFIKNSVEVYVGNPYYTTSFNKGKVKLASGKSFDNYELKLDEVNNQVIYKGADGRDYSFVEEVIAFDFNLDNKNLSFIKAGKDKAYYQVLLNGKNTLLKRNVKSIAERKQYSSATTEKFIQSRVNYALSIDDKFIELSDNKHLLETFSNNEKALNFIKTNKVSVKKEESLIKLVTYVNTL
ncbi:hypothetical protein [Pedobacter sp.]|uniref:hypothetical protein n=1 Tax=Pedobacter sp. TaxID=1411316 RepID=UPI00280AF513|nr:hypothetical protein [Pedobacter sp.]